MIDALLSATRIAQGLDEGQWSSREVVELYLERIARAPAWLNAYTEVYRDQALAAAEAADRLRGAGIVLGPLHGVPIAVKDLLEWQGRLCGVGSMAWRERRSEVTATVIQKLLAAGMIILGKTQMVEFALGPDGINPLLGTPWNPWDLDTHRLPGGSSSGSAVAVAAGLAPIALGSDTGGSVRIPAALNNLVGLKPTHGRISLHGCIPLSTTLDSVGPIARSVDDAARLLAILEGPDPLDPATLEAPLAAKNQERDLAGADARVAVMREDDFPVAIDAACLQAYRAAQETLAGLGVQLRELALPEFSALNERSRGIIAAEAYAYHRDHIHDERAPIGPHVRQRILGGQKISAADYLALRDDQRRARADYREWMRPFDALLLPSSPTAAERLDGYDETRSPIAMFMRPANYLGACALSLPGGFNADGLPVAVQLMGAPHAESVLLALGRLFEQATGYGLRTPDLPRMDDA